MRRSLLSLPSIDFGTNHAEESICSFLLQIFNNRTAFATNTKLESPNATEIAVFGVGAGIKGTLETWALKEANNLGPQP